VDNEWATNTLQLLDGRVLRLALRLKVQQLPALLFDLPPPPVHLPLPLDPFKLLLTGELTAPAFILNLLCALHVALLCLGAVDDGSAGRSRRVRKDRHRLRGKRQRKDCQEYRGCKSYVHGDSLPYRKRSFGLARCRSANPADIEYFRRDRI
jgi:hypothetical protein